jgi:hypothetical protein
MGAPPAVSGVVGTPEQVGDSMTPEELEQIAETEGDVRKTAIESTGLALSGYVSGTSVPFPS